MLGKKKKENRKSTFDTHNNNDNAVKQIIYDKVITYYII